MDMYVRQISRTNKDGSRVRYLQLAHKVRDPETGKPRDQVLYHFGREDELDKAQLKRLIKSLSRFLEPEDRARVEAGLAGLGTDIAARQSLPYGGAYVLDALWRRLELDRTLERLLVARAYEVDIERLLFALVANRALDPRSKLGLERWVGRRVRIEGLGAVQVHTLYRAMDFLVEHASEIEERVFFSTATLLNLEVDLIFFDTTTAYFEMEEEDGEGEGLRRYGRPSKDHRPDLPQVVIGLAVTREGIPVRCWAWPGNTNDASVVEEVQRDLAGWKLSRVVWVVDAGMAGGPGRRIFQQGGGQVIVAEPLRSNEKAIQAALAQPGRFRALDESLEVKELKVKLPSDGRRFVLLRNRAQAERDRGRRERALERLEAEIDRLNRGLARREEGHNRAVCQLLSHPLYGRYVRELEGGELRIDRAAVRAEERYDGKTLLSTTDPSLTPEEVALGYKQLAEVERAFRSLKQTLELRPLYHRLEQRIRAHVLLCWLALLLIRVMEVETGRTWGQMRDELEQLAWLDLRPKDGAIQLTTDLTPEQRKIFKELGIPPPKRVQSVRLKREKT